MNKNKNVEYYLSLPYVTEILAIPEEEGGGFEATVPLLGRWSAVGDGETRAEAVDNLYKSLPDLLQRLIDAGTAIPEPKNDAEELPSGILSLRIARSLHQQVMVEAKREGLSINAYISNVLGQATASKSSVAFVQDIASTEFLKCAAMFVTKASGCSVEYDYNNLPQQNGEAIEDFVMDTYARKRKPSIPTKTVDQPFRQTIQ